MLSSYFSDAGDDEDACHYVVDAKELITPQKKPLERRDARGPSLDERGSDAGFPRFRFDLAATTVDGPRFAAAATARRRRRSQTSAGAGRQFQRGSRR